MFDRIITVTMNPAIDATIWLPGLDLSEPNIALREERYAGGKGVNISRVLRSYGMKEVVTTGICGEENETAFQKLLAGDGVQGDFVMGAGSTRENLSLVIPDGKMLKVNRKGSEASDTVLQQLTEKILSYCDEGLRVLAIFAGSIPPNLTPEVYKKLILQVKEGGAQVVLDTTVFGLEELRAIAPFAIKPNLPEFSKICGVSLDSIDQGAEYSRKLTDCIDYVLVSLGGDGLLCCTAETTVHITPPAVEVRSTVAAGDTTLASFVYALCNGEDSTCAARFAASAGTASVMLEGTAVVTMAEVKAIFEKTTARTL